MGSAQRLGGHLNPLQTQHRRHCEGAVAGRLPQGWVAGQGQPHRPALAAGHLPEGAITQGARLPAGIGAADAHIKPAAAAIDAGGMHATGGGIVLGVDGAAGIHARQLAGVDQGADLGLQIGTPVEIMLPTNSGHARVGEDLGLEQRHQQGPLLQGIAVAVAELEILLGILVGAALAGPGGGRQPDQIEPGLGDGAGHLAHDLVPTPLDVARLPVGQSRLGPLWSPLGQPDQGRPVPRSAGSTRWPAPPAAPASGRRWFAEGAWRAERRRSQHGEAR